MQIRIAGTVNDSIVDGPSMRYTVFTQGCPHHCPGCHNPLTHDFAGGQVVDTQSIIAQMNENPLLDGLTLSGGEPFEQAEACAKLAESAKRTGLNVWIYSGYTWDEILKIGQQNPSWLELLRACDVLVDGRFVLEKRSLELNFCGSSNQRLIDVPKSLEDGRVACISLEYSWPIEHKDNLL